jgi:hypothetical protein
MLENLQITESQALDSLTRDKHWNHTLIGGACLLADRHHAVAPGHHTSEGLNRPRGRTGASIARVGAMRGRHAEGREKPIGGGGEEFH